MIVRGLPVEGDAVAGIGDTASVVDRMDAVVAAARAAVGRLA
jgi:hypothetical protein